MFRKSLKRYLPNQQQVHDHPHLGRFGSLLHDDNIWHLNRRSVSGGLSVGLFVAFLPLPVQMLLAGFAAILFRVNLPIAIISVWVSNPITMPALFYFAYKIGALALGLPPVQFEFELSFSWLQQEIGQLWKPLLLGCLICGSVSALIGNIAIRVLWRWHIWDRHKKRKARKASAKAP